MRPLTELKKSKAKTLRVKPSKLLGRLQLTCLMAQMLNVVFWGGELGEKRLKVSLSLFFLRKHDEFGAALAKLLGV